MSKSQVPQVQTSVQPAVDDPELDRERELPADEAGAAGTEPEPIPLRPDVALPVLPAPSPAGDPRAQGELMRALRRFHVVGTENGADLAQHDFLPALLFVFRDPGRVRTKYPLYLFPPQSADPQNLFEGLNVILDQLVAKVAPGADDGRTLKDNLARLEVEIRRAVVTEARPVPAQPVFTAAAKALLAGITAEKKGAGAQLEADLGALVKAVDPEATLLGLTEAAPVFLLLQAVRSRLPRRHRAFRERLEILRRKLQDLLRVEYHKSAEARSAQALGGALGGVTSAFLDPGALGQVMGTPRGSEVMQPRRRERIGEVLEVVSAYLASDPLPVLTCAHHPEQDLSWLDGAPGVRLIASDDPVGAATEVFDEAAAAMTRLVWAARVAELEVEDAYEPVCHSPIFSHLTWRDFGPEELRLLPPVMAMVSARTVPDMGMMSLSRLLLSGRPVQVLASVQSAGTPGGTVGEGAFSGFRLELGYLGISHREAVVEQSSAARPGHLMESFRRGLDATRPCLYVIASGLVFGGQPSRLGTWLHGGAAIESRAHPFFRYNPIKGEGWARRFNFEANPQPGRDWPVYELPCRQADGSAASLTLAFTFADYALLEPVYHPHFQPVPRGCPEGDLVSVEQWVRLAGDELLRKVPFVWAVDANQRLHQLAISRRLALACRDRLGFWHTLQEMAGIHDEYAQRAAAAARAAAEAEAEVRIAAREAELLAEIERVRAEEAGEALSRLAGALLNTDLASGPVGVRARAPRPPAPGAAPAEASAPAPATTPAEEEEAAANEPYIDTPLCTSCNECTAVNGMLFLYNANKQAYIGDPKAGTFAQLVVSAEKCPAHCIHPGKPQNPNEPGLQDLIARAARFN